MSSCHPQNDRGLTLERLKHLLAYDAESGTFRWRVQRGAMAAGSVAGNSNKRNYGQIKIDGRNYLPARLAWLYMTGEWPESEVDHKDRNEGNNRWDNLRPSTRQQNSANRGLHSNNTSGVKGVSWSNGSKKWYAYIQVNGKSHNLGHYADLDVAKEVRRKAAQHHFGEFAQGD